MGRYFKVIKTHASSKPKQNKPCKAATKQPKKLQKAILNDFPIPDEINNLECGYSVQSDSLLVQKLCVWSVEKPAMRMNETNYLDAYHTMLYLEEAAEARFAEKFNKSHVQLFWSEVENSFFFPLSYNNDMSDICSAYDENIVDSFTLKAYLNNEPFETNGKLVRKGYKEMFVNIEKCGKMLKDNINQMPYFDVAFKINRQPYQLQHTALDFLLKHHLFSRLINNPKYDSIEADAYACDDFIPLTQDVACASTSDSQFASIERNQIVET